MSEPETCEWCSERIFHGCREEHQGCETSYQRGLAERDAEVARLREALQECAVLGAGYASGRAARAALTPAATGAKPKMFCKGPDCDGSGDCFTGGTSPRAEPDEVLLQRCDDWLEQNHEWATAARLAPFVQTERLAASAETVRAVCEALRKRADGPDYVHEHNVMLADWIEAKWGKGGSKP